MRRCLQHVRPDPLICQACAAYTRDRRRRTRAIAVVLALLGVTAAITLFIVTRPQPSRAPGAPLPAGTRRDADTIVNHQRERLAATPCEPKTSLHLVERLIELERWGDAKAAAEASIESCGAIGKMRWRLVYACQQARDWPCTTKYTSALIAAYPHDSDFWWWRADGWTGDGKPRRALADYRQALALMEPGGGNLVASRLLPAAKAAGALCEAERAWRYHASALRGIPTQEVRDEVAALVRSHACARERGTGRGRLARAVTVTLGGATGSFRVDPSVGTTLVSRMFAAQAGLDPVDDAGEERGEAHLNGKLVAGAARQVTLRAGGLSASHVDVLITDDLTGDQAGVLGMSFLWQFAIAWTDGGALVLEQLPDRPL